jgi:Holliday junction resolvasome RuvABC endonuclease subunit
MTILALDASTTTIGYAAMNGDELLQWGAFTPSGPLYDRIAQGGDWLRRWLDLHGTPETVAIERPFVGASWDSTIKQSYMVGTLIAVARSRGANVVEVNPQERLNAAGISSKAPSLKRACVAVVNQVYGLKLKVSQHDIADAILVGWAAQRAAKLEAME